MSALNPGTGPADGLAVAFESGQLSYSDHPVDMYNSGVNQLASLAAARGHRLYHFRMADLFRHEQTAHARTSVLALDDSWDGDELSAWRHLRKVEEQTLPLEALDLYFVRGDDIHGPAAPNLDVLREAEQSALVIETVAATLATCDKFALPQRCPHAAQPITYRATDLDSAMDAVDRLPSEEGSVVLKDRYGYGCGLQVHRLHLETPDLEETVREYVRTYGDVLLQEFRPEVAEGDLVVTFFDDELIGAMRRVPASDEWKANASLGATHQYHELTDAQAETAWAVRRAFPECRLTSVDLLISGRALEVNAFPGAVGLLETHGIVLAERVLDRLEAELAAPPPQPAGAAGDGGDGAGDPTTADRGVDEAAR